MGIDHVVHLALLVAHWLAGFIVLSEGLNKLHRTDPLAPGLDRRQRLVVLLKAFAWVLLVLGAGGAVVRPLVAPAIGAAPALRSVAIYLVDQVSVVDACVLGGFAVLIVRSRLKEG